MGVEPVPFLVVAAAETEVELPHPPIEALRDAALRTEEKLRQLADELADVGQKLGRVQRVTVDLPASDHGLVGTLRRNIELHGQLAEAAESLQDISENRRIELKQAAQDVSQLERRAVLKAGDYVKNNRRSDILFMAWGIASAIIFVIEVIELVLEDAVSFFDVFGAAVVAMLFSVIVVVPVVWIFSGIGAKRAKERAESKAREGLAEEVRSTQSKLKTQTVLTRKLSYVRRQLQELASTNTVGPETGPSDSDSREIR